MPENNKNIYMQNTFGYTQKEILFAEQLKQAGIEQAVNHADDAAPYNWSEKAFGFFQSFLNGVPPGFSFMTEDIILKAEQLKAVPMPPDPRAWGAIAVKARRDGLIKSTGLAPRKNPTGHRSFCTVWAKL